MNDQHGHGMCWMSTGNKKKTCHVKNTHNGHDRHNTLKSEVVEERKEHKKPRIRNTGGVGNRARPTFVRRQIIARISHAGITGSSRM